VMKLVTVVFFFLDLKANSVHITQKIHLNIPYQCGTKWHLLGTN